jgi:hypothetical protein
LIVSHRLFFIATLTIKAVSTSTTFFTLASTFTIKLRLLTLLHAKKIGTASEGVYRFIHGREIAGRTGADYVTAFFIELRTSFGLKGL